MSGSKIRVGIAGGGAAGLYAACCLAKFSGGKDIEITVIERNSIPGKKLILTGHGRCNITNRKDISDLKKGYHEAENFIYPALREFGPEETIRFFENDLGLAVKEEDNNRIFPVCDSAVKVRDAILSYLSCRAKILTDTKVTGIKTGEVFSVSTSNGGLQFDFLILSSGGSSFPKTGSTGDSYKLAEALGHTIIPVRGALAPVKTDKESQQFTLALSGVSVNSKVSLFVDGKMVRAVSGEMLFADFGLTGPAIMELSREIPDKVTGNTFLELDFIPQLNEEQLDQEFLKLISEHPDTKIVNLLSRYVPSSVACEICRKADVYGLYAQGFTKENRKRLCREIKHLKVLVDEPSSFDKAYVTRGGVSLKEVDRKTMESKKVPGLYIIGEALDIDGISGGYNLQACMSEAYLAAKNILGN
ncbi:hypothetical protein SAMN02910264_00069 [Ruminococcaceae bacterium YAD3003]|nr:hypothetical protein SAMN02910264_00069 [Ruminococcaceae bacterium YAD3003]